MKFGLDPKFSPKSYTSIEPSSKVAKRYLLFLLRPKPTIEWSFKLWVLKNLNSVFEG